MIKKLIASAWAAAYPMKMHIEPLPKKAVVIGAPHTSMFDAVLMKFAFWKAGRDIKWMVKNQAADKPVIGSLIKMLGGISIDRSAAHGVTHQVAQKAKAADEFLLVIAPKGTRAPRKYWKSGFYYIALEADIPVVLGFIDMTTKTYGWGPTYHLTGDIVKDMDVIRAFYKGKTGYRPELTSEPRLKGEDEARSEGSDARGDGGAQGDDDAGQTSEGGQE